jgi:hypothetical protein
MANSQIDEQPHIDAPTKCLPVSEDTSLSSHFSHHPAIFDLALQGGSLAPHLFVRSREEYESLT